MQGQLSEDEDRGQGLASPLADDVDEGLGPGTQAVGNRQEQQLGGGAVKRGTKRAVGALENEGGQQPAPEGHARRAQQEQARQHPQGAVQAEHAQQPAHRHELRGQGEHVEDHVEGGEERAQLRRRDVPGHRALEDVVGQRDRDRGDEHEAGKAREVRVVAHELHRLGQVRRHGLRSRLGPGPLGAAQNEGRPEAGDRKRGRRGEHEIRSRQGGADEPCHAGSRHRSQHAAQSDDAVDALGLGDRVHLAEDEPELQAGQRAHEARPDVQRAQRPRVPPRAEEPEQERDCRAREEQLREAVRSGQPSRAVPRTERQADRDHGHRQVHPGELGRREPGEKERVTRGLEQGMAGQDPEEGQERSGDTRPLFGTNVGEGAQHWDRTPRRWQTTLRACIISTRPPVSHEGMSKKQRSARFIRARSDGGGGRMSAGGCSRFVCTPPG